MLIRFNVKNFLSINTDDEGNSQELCMIAGKTRSYKERIYKGEDQNILKFAALYGANASGKTNVIKAMEFMKKAVVDRLPAGHVNMYCKTNKENQNKSSYFSTEILLGDKTYNYGFEIMLCEGRYLSEWLYELKQDGDTLIFERDIVNEEYKIGDLFKPGEVYNRIKMYLEDIDNAGKALFIKNMNTDKSGIYIKYKELGIFNEIYRWFDDTLDVNYPSTQVSAYARIGEIEDIDIIGKYTKAFGTGIQSIVRVDCPMKEVFRGLGREEIELIFRDIEKVSEQAVKGKLPIMIWLRIKNRFYIVSKREKDVHYQEVKFNHTKEMVEESWLFDITEESDGTVRLLDLLEILLTKGGKTFLIDELDRCLHPQLTCKFVQTFLEIAQKRNVQLIVSTHESRLLDFQIIRRDEVWFVEKNKNGETSLYSLEEFNDRFDKKIDRAYLDGRYGGVPIFNNVFPMIEE